MKYRDLFIDVDDTLLDFGKDELHAITTTFNALQIDANSTNINLYIAINASLWELHNQGKFEKSKIRTARFAYTLSVLQREDIDPSVAANIYVDALSQTGNLFSGVIETLHQLKEKGHRIYLITNGFTTIQTPRLKRSGLDSLVDGIFISEQIGFNKPDVAFMEYVSQHIDDFDKDNSLIIGDSYSSDIQLGLNANIDTVAITSNDIPQATYQLPSFTQILSILD